MQKCAPFAKYRKLISTAYRLRDCISVMKIKMTANVLSCLLVRTL